MATTKLRACGAAPGGIGRILGRVTRTSISDKSLRKDFLRVIPKDRPYDDDFEGYAAILYEESPVSSVNVPYTHSYGDLDFLQDDYIAVVDISNGFTNVLYRPESRHNGLFLTDRCNSNCIMCVQPPRDVNDDGMTDEVLRIIELIPDRPEQLIISGGEPTLLKDGLISIIQKLKVCLPETAVTMLSNARMYAYSDYVDKISAIQHGNFLTSVPLYAGNAVTHDFIVQSKGAFDQTIQGLYNAARKGLFVELRVVLHKQTVPGLSDMVDFIYRNIPFVAGVVLMGMENMGYVKKNWDLLWEDPVDYAQTLETAVQKLHYRRIPVSLYNLPLCILPESLWSFAEQSISDFKNIYLDECEKCSVKTHCGGFFASSEDRHSRGIKAISWKNYRGPLETRFFVNSLDMIKANFS
jgi:His-Xaa-Ser system radical SAM maturase HxsC